MGIFTSKPRPFHVYRVYVLDNSNWTQRLDITSTFDFEHVVPASDIGALCGWDDWRIEVRYIQGGEKYRVVFYNTDVVVPLYTDEELANKKTSVFETLKSYPVSATASTSKDVEGKKSTAVDVTKHVQKYAGPRRNWYADRPQVTKRVEYDHMFFGDDRRTMKMWYPCLHMRTMKTLTSHPII
jgi:hypothetical protein